MTRSSYLYSLEAYSLNADVQVTIIVISRTTSAPIVHTNGATPLVFLRTARLKLLQQPSRGIYIHQSHIFTADIMLHFAKPTVINPGLNRQYVGWV